MKEASAPTGHPAGRRPILQAEAIARMAAYQNQLDRSLTEGRHRFDDLFDNAPPGLGLHQIDRQAVVRRVNRQELELLGYREQDVVGHPAWKFAVMQETSRRAVERKLAGGELKPFVRTFARADGSAVTLAIVERHVRDAAGRITGIRTALMEIALG